MICSISQYPIPHVPMVENIRLVEYFVTTEREREREREREINLHLSYEKVQVGNDQEMAQSERNSHSINRGVGKNYNDT